MIGDIIFVSAVLDKHRECQISHCTQSSGCHKTIKVTHSTLAHIPHTATTSLSAHQPKPGLSTGRHVQDQRCVSLTGGDADSKRAISVYKQDRKGREQMSTLQSKLSKRKHLSTEGIIKKVNNLCKSVYYVCNMH
jgi:hypothetical protein